MTQALSLDQCPFPGWKSWVRRAVFLSPKEFPGLPSGRKAARLPLLCPSQLQTGEAWDRGNARSSGN